MKKWWSEATGKGTYCFQYLQNYYSSQIVLSSLRQRVQKAPVSTAWLSHYNIEQSLSRSDLLAAYGLNAFQVFFCQHFMLKHVPSDRLCVDCRRQSRRVSWRRELTKHTCVIWNISKHTTLSVLSYKRVTEATDHRLRVLPVVMINMTMSYFKPRTPKFFAKVFH